MLIATLAGCLYKHDTRHFDVLGRPDPVLVVPATRPLPEDYVVGEPVSASGCEGEQRVDIQRLIEAARGDHDAIVQMTVQTRVLSTCVALARTTRQLEAWDPGSPIDCASGQTATPGVQVALAATEVCYVVSGRAADIPSGEGEAPTAASTIAPVNPSTGHAPLPATPSPVPATSAPSATITLAAGAPPFTGVEVRCPSGFRVRADFVDDVATIGGVPDEACDLLFKGGAPARAKVTGPQSLTCSFRGVAADCR